MRRCSRRRSDGPVRLQYMRADGTGWDPKGPPIAFRMRAGLDAHGRGRRMGLRGARLLRAHPRHRAPTSRATRSPAQLIGGYKAKSTDEHAVFRARATRFANKRKVSHIVAVGAARWARALRTAHLRDPDGMATLLRVRIVRGRGRVRGGHRSGRVPPALSHRRARAGGGARGGREGGMAARMRSRGARQGAHRARAGHRLRAAPRHGGGDRGGSRGRSRDGPLPRDALHRRARLRLRRESAQPARHHRGQPDPGA